MTEKEQPELANGVGEALVVHRLGDVDVATEFMQRLISWESSVVVSTTTAHI